MDYNKLNTNDFLADRKIIVDISMIFVIVTSIIVSMYIGIFVSFLFGIGTFIIVRVVESFIEKKLLIRNKSRLFATFIISSLFLILLILGFYKIIVITMAFVSNPNEVINNASLIIDSSIRDLPSFLKNYIPSNISDIKNSILSLIKGHLVYIRDFGKETTYIFLNCLFGSVIGIMIGYSTFLPSDKILINSFRGRLINLIRSYVDIIIAQFAISIFNTLMTVIFLYFLKLPFIDIVFPFTKTIIALTFLFGLIPIFGNIIVNLIVFTIGLSVSMTAGVVALIYLIVIHKFEYFLNARIIGSRTNSKAWELLLAMLVMESMFGMIGLIAAPILYTYLKRELVQIGVI